MSGYRWVSLCLSDSNSVLHMYKVLKLKKYIVVHIHGRISVTWLNEKKVCMLLTRYVDFNAQYLITHFHL